MTFAEQLIRKKKTAKDYALLALIWAVAFLLTIGALYVALGLTAQTNNSAPLALTVFLGAGAFWLAFRLSANLTVEYEYSAFEGELMVDKIVAKRKRTRVVQVAAKRIEQLSPMAAYTKETVKFDRVVMAAPSEAEATWYVTYSGKKNGHTAVLFSPSEDFFEEMYNGQTRAVQTACDEARTLYGV